MSDIENFLDDLEARNFYEIWAARLCFAAENAIAYGWENSLCDMVLKFRRAEHELINGLSTKAALQSPPIDG